MNLPWLDPDNIAFPSTREAFDEPNGLLAAGGHLSPEWLLAAYQQGIFPWFNDGDPILWWSPSPRMVLYPAELHISRSLHKTLKKTSARVTINHDFQGVINACSEPRAKQLEEDADMGTGTWINREMAQAYIRLHRLGYAHSVEVWDDNTLVGGLYGIALDKVFFGESMFSRISNASKIAISHLAHYLTTLGYELIDCQVHNEHLDSLGAVEISRNTFENIISEHAQLPNPTSYLTQWQPKVLINPYL